MKGFIIIKINQECINSATTLENSLMVPQKVKDVITIWPNNFIPEYTAKRNENMFTKTYT